jgi:drug/metabolite transporter (DMT)-like permease
MQRLLGSLCLASAAAIWGGTYVVSKYVLDFTTPLLLVVIRFCIAAAALGLFVLLTRPERVRRADWPRIASYGFVGYTLSIGAQFIGTQLSSAHMGAVITSASPAFIVLFAWWLLKERMTLKKILTLAIATLGVMIVIGGDAGSDSGTFVGNLILVVAAVTWALYTVLGKSLTETYRTLTLSLWATVCGVVFTLPLAAWEVAREGVKLPGEPLVWWGILYLGVISTAVAFFLWAQGFRMLDAGSASLFFFIQPVFGTWLGWLLLGEHLTLSFGIGSVLILGSVAFSMLTPEPQNSSKSSTRA